MNEYLLGLIQLRRGTTAERLQVVFEAGEPVIDLDEEEIYIGDGETLGGVPAFKRVNVVNTTTSVVATPAKHNDYLRFNGNNLTYTFSANQSFVTGREYHGRNAGSSPVTIVGTNGFVIHAPTEGTLVIPPGGTFTVKIVGAGEADLFGITDSD